MHEATVPDDDLHVIVAAWRWNKVARAVIALVRRRERNEAERLVSTASGTCDGCLEFYETLNSYNQEFHRDKLSRKGLYQHNGRLLCGQCYDWYAD